MVAYKWWALRGELLMTGLVAEIQPYVDVRQVAKLLGYPSIDRNEMAVNRF